MQYIHQVCYTRYQVSFYLRRIGSALEHCKVPRYYDQDCRSLKSSREIYSACIVRVLCGFAEKIGVVLQN